MEIKNTSEVLSKTRGLSEAVSMPVYVHTGMGPQEIKDKQAIWNMETNTVSSVTSNRYQIIQHRDVFGAVHDALSELGIEVAGRLDNHYHFVKADLVFQNQGVPVRDDADGIQLGIRVMNSYNLKSAFRLEMFGFRTVCQNGMSMGHTMEVREIVFHTGEEKTHEKLLEITRKFIKNVIDSNLTLQKYVDTMIKDTMEWSIIEKIIPGLIKRKKHLKQVLTRLEPGKTVSRWDLYNAITNYISHGESLTDSAIRHLEQRSKMVLTTPLKHLEEKYVENKVEV